MIGTCDSTVPHSYYYRGHFGSLWVSGALGFVADWVEVVFQGGVPAFHIDRLVPETLGPRPFPLLELGGHHLLQWVELGIAWKVVAVTEPFGPVGFDWTGLGEVVDGRGALGRVISEGIAPI